MKDNGAMQKERMIIRANATKDEEKLYDLLFAFEEKYFEDLTLTKFEYGKMTKTLHEDGSIEYADIDEARVSIGQCLIRIMEPNLKDNVAAIYDKDENTIIVYKGRYERHKKETLLHEMIHAYDRYLIKHCNMWRDYLVIHLYNKILKKTGARRLHTMINSECNALFMVNVAHGPFFLLKSLDLDIRLNKKLGTIFGYNRKERYKK